MTSFQVPLASFSTHKKNRTQISKIEHCVATGVMWSKSGSLIGREPCHEKILQYDWLRAVAFQTTYYFFFFFNKLHFIRQLLTLPTILSDYNVQ